MRTPWERLFFKSGLLLIGDGAGWIVDQVALALARHLPKEWNPHVVARGWERARRSTLHFISRTWAWSDGVLDKLDSSNRLLGLWWHGRLDSPEAGVQAALTRARRLHPRFEIIQVTCSSALETMRAIGVAREKIVLLPEGVDLNLFHPPPSTTERMQARRRLGIPAHAIAIGSFQKDGVGWSDGSTPKWIKGPDIWVEALNTLRRSYPVHAVIPGPSRGYVKRRLAELGIPFSAPGFVSQGKRLADCYHALDIYLSASRDEGGPAGVLESMASGVPVVSTATGVAADMIQQGVNGFLADVEDREGLCSGVSQLVETENLRRRMAQEALKTIAAYDWALLAQRYAKELYARVL